MSHDVRLATLQRQPAAAVRAHVTRDGIAEFLAGVFDEVMTVLLNQGRRPAGPPFGRYLPDGDGFQVEAGFPVDRPVANSGRVTPIELPGGDVAYTVHTGPYDTVAAAYEDVAEWLTDSGFVTSGGPWESYLDGPEVPRPRTEVFFPCKPVRPASTSSGQAPSPPPAQPAIGTTTI